MAKKVKEFTNTSINLMGEEFFFKRCSTETLKKYDEQMQEKMKSSDTVRKERESLINELERKEAEIDVLNRKLDIIDKKENPSDDELDDSLKLLDRIDSALDEIKIIRDKIETYNQEYEDYWKTLNEELNEIIAEKGEALLDGFDKEVFLKEHDIVDMRIMTNISKYYEMCMLGERASKVQEAIRLDAERLSGRDEEFRKRR